MRFVSTFVTQLRAHMAPAAMAAVLFAGGSAQAHAEHQIPYLGSTWSYTLYEFGAAEQTVLMGQPSLQLGQREAVITLTGRDGHILAPADQALGSEVARILCEQGGRRFNTQATGHWLSTGDLSFNGACTQ